VEARPVVEEIAALDADFKAGRVEEEPYRQKRDALKRCVREVLAR
jgi:flagellar biosynthesis component FlhA